MQIIDRRTKLKARRALRKQKRQVEEVASQADDEVEKYVFRRFSHLLVVRRFVGLWVIFLFMLGVGTLWQVRGMDTFYLTTAPAPGGVYREGIIGTFTNANPLFATGAVDSSVSKLVFSGLFKMGPDAKLDNDLASKLTINETGSTYTVELRKDVLWQDGEKFDADDVMFTYGLIQNPDVRSVLFESWKGVKITKLDQYAVKFELPNSLSSFKYTLTNGIVPKHILESAKPISLRSNKFNTVKPIGTGAFELRTLEADGGTSLSVRQESIALSSFDDYFGPKPGFDSMVLKSYPDEQSMIKDFDSSVIQSMVGLSSVSDDISSRSDVNIISVPFTSSVMAFFNTTNTNISDKKVRQALLLSLDAEAIRNGLGFRVITSDSPFLRSQFAYDSKIVEQSKDVTKSKALFDEAGWLLNKDGMREKDGKVLTLRLVSQSLSEYATVSQKIQTDWAAVGVKIIVVLQPEESIQSSTIANHDYDVLLYGISIGDDPDVFAYWHSSQADPNSASRLNLSEYKSDVADEALEAGRTRVDEKLRKVKYEPFLKAWRDDVPAIALYQPRFLMVVQGTFDGFKSSQMNSAINRYSSIDM